jgi:erythritol kinase
MKRWQPDRITRAATCFHCKELTGARVTDPSEWIFTFGNYRTRKYEPSILEGMGIADCERLLTPMIEGTEEAGSLSAAAAAATGLGQGTPVSLGYIDVVCVAAGGRIHDPSRDIGVSVMGSTGMHMRYAPTPDDVCGSMTTALATRCAFLRTTPAPPCSPTWPPLSISIG